VLSIYRDDIKEKVAAAALETGRRGTSAYKAHLYPRDARFPRNHRSAQTRLGSRVSIGWM